MIRHLFDNLGWKLLAVAIASALWVTFVSSPELATSIAAPVEYRNIPADLEMIADAGDRVHLEIQGPSARLHNFDLSRTSVTLDLSAVHRPGARTFTIDGGSVRLPAGLNLIKAVPAQIRIQFERRVTREIPVRLRLSAPAPEGYRIARQEVVPSRVGIVGPESRVGAMEYAETDPIDLARAAGQTEFRVALFLHDPQVRFQSVSAVRVRLGLEKLHDTQ